MSGELQPQDMMTDAGSTLHADLEIMHTIDTPIFKELLGMDFRMANDISQLGKLTN